MKRQLAISIFLSFSIVMGYALDNTSHAVTLRVDDTCRMALNSTAPVTLAAVIPTIGGAKPAVTADDSKFLRYTSLVPGNASRKITVNWGTADIAPAGLSLLVQVTNMPADCGSACGQVAITGEPQNLVTEIRSCATGAGSGKATIRYTLRIDDTGRLVAGDSTTITVSFTLTDAL